MLLVLLLLFVLSIVDFDSLKAAVMLMTRSQLCYLYYGKWDPLPCQKRLLRGLVCEYYCFRRRNDFRVTNLGLLKKHRHTVTEQIFHSISHNTHSSGSSCSLSNYDFGLSSHRRLIIIRCTPSAHAASYCEAYKSKTKKRDRNCILSFCCQSFHEKTSWIRFVARQRFFNSCRFWYLCHSDQILFPKIGRIHIKRTISDIVLICPFSNVSRGLCAD